MTATSLCSIFVWNLERPFLASSGCGDAHCRNCIILEKHVLPFYGVSIGTEEPMTEKEKKQLDRQRRKVCDSAFDLLPCACTSFVFALVYNYADDFQNAESAFNSAFSYGIPFALEKCALMFLNESERLPTGTMKNQMLKKAIEYLHKAIEATKSISCLRLLGMIIHDSDPDESLKFLCPAAESGDPLSMNLLIKMAKSGKIEKALKWVRTQLKIPGSNIYDTLFTKWYRS